MKSNYLLVSGLLFISIFSYSQSNVLSKDSIKVKNNELSVNFFKAFLNKYELSYHYILNDQSSIGTSISYSPKISNIFNLASEEQFSIKANYRYYFSNKRAQGFFVEGYVGYSKGKYLDVNYQNNTYEYISDYNSIYAGFNIGYKYVTKKNLFFEASAGFGRVIYNFNGYPNAFVPHMSLSIGKRF